MRLPVGLLGKPIHSANFLNAFTDFGVSEWELDEHIDLRREYGVEIYLYAEQPLNSEDYALRASICCETDLVDRMAGWASFHLAWTSICRSTT